MQKTKDNSVKIDDANEDKEEKEEDRSKEKGEHMLTLLSSFSFPILFNAFH